MMTRLVILFGILLLQSTIYGQSKKEKEYKPFSLLIINPDSISMDEALKPLVDTVESEFREFYYSSLKQMAVLEEFEPEEKRKETQLKIQRAKWAEMDVHDTRYYQLIPMLTCAELWYLFNGPNNSEFSFNFISKEELFSYDLNKIANTYHLDYILTYKQITTPIQDGEPTLKIEMQLFGTKESKIIYETVSYGKARFYKDNSGTLRACSNDLECLLESGVISSTADLFSFLKKRQKK